MDLTNNKLLAALSAVVLTGLIALAVYFISHPYIQYEEGRVYRTGAVSVVSVRLENKGYFDAEQVNVEAVFPELITEITSGDAISSFGVTSGGKGFKIVGGSIPRISPSQATYVYFAVDNSSGVIGEVIPGFVRKVTFKNGVGSTEPPMWIWIITTLLLCVVSGVLNVFASRFYYKHKAIAKDLEALKVSSAKSQEHFEQLVATYEDFLGRVKDGELAVVRLRHVDNSTNINKTGD